MAVAPKKLVFEQDVLDALSRLTWIGEGEIVAAMPKLDRALYLRVDKALQALGGKWNRRKGGHVFAEDPRPQIDALIAGEPLLVERDGFFPTPVPVVVSMVALYRRMAGRVTIAGPVLEPEAGEGHLIDALRHLGYTGQVQAVEKAVQRRLILREKGYPVSDVGDFLAYEPATRFPSIFMNPPFENMQDVDHVTHAFDVCLDYGGVLVSVTSDSWTFRNERKAKAFSALVEEYGFTRELPDRSFASASSVRARLVALRMPGDLPRPGTVQPVQPCFAFVNE